MELQKPHIHMITTHNCEPQRTSLCILNSWILMINYTQVCAIYITYNMYTCNINYIYIFLQCRLLNIFNIIEQVYERSVQSSNVREPKAELFGGKVQNTKSTTTFQFRRLRISEHLHVVPGNVLQSTLQGRIGQGGIRQAPQARQGISTALKRHCKTEVATGLPETCFQKTFQVLMSCLL